MGLSFAELNLLTLDDYVTFTEILNPDEDEVREATQADIDQFLG